jgi:UDP-glucose 4-epimerase
LLYPREYNQVNVGGTVTLMEAMRDVGVRRVVFISSGAIYGDQETQPLREDATPRPRSPYAVSKLAAEYYVCAPSGSCGGIETVCLRVFNAYGPGQHMPPVHAPVIPAFLRQASLNGTLIVHGEGTQTRDYVYVATWSTPWPPAATAPDVDQHIINVGTGQEVSIRELVRLALEVTGGDPEVVYNPRNDRGPAHMCADLTLARQKLGYQPQTLLEEGLRKTLELDLRLR